MKISQGVTIVELLIYLGLMSIFLLTLTEIFLSVLETQTESQQTSSVEQDGRFILARLNYDISRADNIINPVTLGQATSSATLVISGVSYTYDGSDDTNLFLTDDSGKERLNSYGTVVSNVAFRRLGNSGGKNSLQIVWRLTSVSKRTAGVEVKDFQTTIGTR